MATGGKETINVNKMNNQKIIVNNRIVNKQKSNPTTVAGSTIGTNVLQNILCSSEGRTRKCPAKFVDFHMKNKSSNANIAPETTSFYNSCRDKIPTPRDDVEKILPNSQPLAASNSVPLSTTNIDCSQTAGRGTETNVAHNVDEREVDLQATSGVLSPSAEVEDVNCPICRIDVGEEEEGIVCEECNVWSHRACLFMTPVEYQTLTAPSSDPWFCVTCSSIRANKIKWGEMTGESSIKKKLSSIYNEIVTWRKNLFMVPRGKVGTDFIKEITRIIQLFTAESKWTRLSLSMLHVFIPL